MSVDVPVTLHRCSPEIKTRAAALRTAVPTTSLYQPWRATPPAPEYTHQPTPRIPYCPKHTGELS